MQTECKSWKARLNALVIVAFAGGDNCNSINIALLMVVQFTPSVVLMTLFWLFDHYNFLGTNSLFIRQIIKSGCFLSS